MHYPRQGWLDHQRPRVVDRPVPELVVQLLETYIAWRQPKQSEKQTIVYFVEVQQPKKREKILELKPLTDIKNPIWFQKIAVAAILANGKLFFSIAIFSSQLVFTPCCSTFQL